MAPGLREQKKIDTWHSLRRAALELVAAHGFDVVTVDEIAAAAQVSKRTFFNYFDSKEAVLFDADPAEPALWADLAAARPSAEDVWSAVDGFFVDYVGKHAQKLPLLKRIISSSPTLAATSRSTSEPFREFVRSWIADRLGGATFEADIITATAFTVMNEAMTAWEPDSGVHELQALIQRGFAVVNTRTTPPAGRRRPTS